MIFCQIIVKFADKYGIKVDDVKEINSKFR